MSVNRVGVALTGSPVPLIWSELFCTSCGIYFAQIQVLIIWRSLPELGFQTSSKVTGEKEALTQQHVLLYTLEGGILWFEMLSCPYQFYQHKLV